MRAIIQKSFGGPEVLELTDGAARPTQVLVRVRATSVNPTALKY